MENPGRANFMDWYTVKTWTPHYLEKTTRKNGRLSERFPETFTANCNASGTRR